MNLIEKNAKGEDGTFMFLLHERNIFDNNKFKELVKEISRNKEKSNLRNVIHIVNYIKNIFISSLWNEVNNSISEILNLNKNSDIFFKIIEDLDTALYDFLINNGYKE